MSSVLRGLGVVWAGATPVRVVIAALMVSTGLVFAASVSAQGTATKRVASRAAWAVPLALAALGSIVPGAMLLGREQLMVAVLAGSTVLSSTVPFLLLWGFYALVCVVRSNLTTLQLLAVLRRGMDVGLISVAIAWGIALLAGGHLIRLVALSGFHAFLMPWVIGFGLSFPSRAQDSRRRALRRSPSRWPHAWRCPPSHGPSRSGTTSNASGGTRLDAMRCSDSTTSRGAGERTAHLPGCWRRGPWVS
jgi:hypothetical protein